MSEINLFNRWRVRKLYFWIGIGLIPVLCVAIFLMSTGLFLPMGGEAYYGQERMSAPAANFGGGFDGEYAEYDLAVEESYPESIDDAKGYTGVDTATASANGGAVVNRLIIREGSISIYAEKTRQTRNDIEALVASFAEEGGYVINASESSRGEGLEPYISMSIRVPVEQFDYVMDAIAEMSVEVINSNENAQDVTEEYVDLAGRIEALEASRNRLLELMANSEFTEDLLRAEQELTVREAELEAMQGRLNYLSESARLSRIYIDLQPYELYEPIDTSWKPAVTFRNAVENLVESIQGFADFMISFGVSVLPWLVFFGLIIWGVVVLVKRGKRKQQSGE